jgi:putative ABC transport system permease protein
MYRSIYQTSDLATDLVVRTAGDPGTLAAAVDREIRAVDPDLPLYGIATMEELLASHLSQRRFSTLVLSAFAAVALLLAAIGIFGVLAFLVQQRTSEIGIRVALGADRKDILRLVLGKGFGLILTGVAVGIAVSALATRLLSTLLFGVTPLDASAFVGIPALLIGIALLACYIPARRASRIDPVVALRNE